VDRVFEIALQNHFHLRELHSFPSHLQHLRFRLLVTWLNPNFEHLCLRLEMLLLFLVAHFFKVSSCLIRRRRLVLRRITFLFFRLFMRSKDRQIIWDNHFLGETDPYQTMPIDTLKERCGWVRIDFFLGLRVGFFD